MNDILGKNKEKWEGEKEINYLIHEYSRVILDKTTSIDELKLNNREIFEVRIFNSKMELFIYKQDNEWKQIHTLHNNEDKDFIDKEYELESKFKSRFKTITVRKYIGYKDDMAYIRKSCLIGLREGENNG